ncbi:MAG: hypothetical protein IH966_00655 [Gemmatimonadetes bacterium]|nr:hypothetical protein [Gemmatimonadota bacterium]
MRSRDKILTNLESIYREAYDRAKQAEDAGRMMDMDAAYQREQLLLEVLMDIRDAIHSIGDAPNEKTALQKLHALKKLTKLR